MKKYTAEEKEAILELIAEARRAGKSKEEAATEVGIHPVTYHRWVTGKTQSKNQGAGKDYRTRLKRGETPKTRAGLYAKLQARGEEHLARCHTLHGFLSPAANSAGISMVTLASWLRGGVLGQKLKEAYTSGLANRPTKESHAAIRSKPASYHSLPTMAETVASSAPVKPKRPLPPINHRPDFVLACPCCGTALLDAFARATAITERLQAQLAEDMGSLRG